jgi:hypothetical protein
MVPTASWSLACVVNCGLPTVLFVVQPAITPTPTSAIKLALNLRIELSPFICEILAFQIDGDASGRRCAARMLRHAST